MDALDGSAGTDNPTYTLGISYQASISACALGSIRAWSTLSRALSSLALYQTVHSHLPDCRKKAACCNYLVSILASICSIAQLANIIRRLGKALPRFPKPTHVEYPLRTGPKPWISINLAINRIPKNRDDHNTSGTRLRTSIPNTGDGNRESRGYYGHMQDYILCKNVGMPRV